MNSRSSGKYGIIGNKFTTALAGHDGSIDWCCLPNSHSPTIFSAFIDPSAGGYFRIRPTDQFSSYQHYIRSTNVVETAFKGPSGTLILTDYMPAQIDDEDRAHHEIIRVMRCCDGNMEIEVDFFPRFNYGRGWNRLTLIAGGVLVRNYDETGVLTANVTFVIEKGHALARVNISSGEEVGMVFCYGVFSPSRRTDRTIEKLVETVRYWRGWVPSANKKKAHKNISLQDAFTRSLLVLKLHTNPLSGLPVESPIISRTYDDSVFFDGRLCWIHVICAALSAYVCNGYRPESEKLLSSLMPLCSGYLKDDGFGNVVLPDGQKTIREIQIKDAAGKTISFRSPGMLAVGSGYYAIGLIMEALSDFFVVIKKPPDRSQWGIISSLLSRVRDVWKNPDGDFWRVDGEKRHYVISKILCWTAVNRGLKMASHYRLNADISMWESLQEEIRRDIITQGYDPEKKAFVRFYGSSQVDLSGLLIPRTGFLSADDDRMINTLAYVTKNFAQDAADNSVCTCYLADCLARMGKKEDAQDLLVQMVKRFEPAYLFSEKIKPVQVRTAGYFPHVLAHAVFINAMSSINDHSNAHARS